MINGTLEPGEKAPEIVIDPDISPGDLVEPRSVVVDHSSLTLGDSAAAALGGLVLVIKAKLEAIESDISTFEEEFLAYTLLPDKRTVLEFMEPQIQAAYLSGEAPKMLTEF